MSIRAQYEWPYMLTIPRFSVTIVQRCIDTQFIFVIIDPLYVKGPFQYQWPLIII